MSSNQSFTLADFQRQIRQMTKLRSMGQILKMIPGVQKLAELLTNVDPDQDMAQVDAMISSMTAWEREHPEQIGPDRQLRIANGSGVARAKVAGFLSDFAAMSQLMVQLAHLGFRERQRAVKEIAISRLRFRNPPSHN